MAKINATAKAVDAATRLVLGKDKEAHVVVYDGWMVSADQDAAAPCKMLPPGIYKGDELLGVYGIFKHLKEININTAQEGGSWVVRLTADVGQGAMATHDLSWREATAINTEAPPTVWPVTKEFLKQIRTIHTLVGTLKKEQLRYVELDPTGCVRLTTPMFVADWYQGDDHIGLMDYVRVAPADLRRASLYRGSKLSAIGTSDGKINFLYHDGAWLRVNTYSDGWWERQDVDPFFKIEGEILDIDSNHGKQLVQSIASAPVRGYCLDGINFVSSIDQPAMAEPLPVATCVSAYNKKPIIELMDYANKIQIAGPETPWKHSRLALYGHSFRAVIDTTLSEEESRQNGMTG